MEGTPKILTKKNHPIDLQGAALGQAFLPSLSEAGRSRL